MAATIGNTSTYAPTGSTTNHAGSLTLSDAPVRKVVVKVTCETISTTPHATSAMVVNGTNITANLVNGTFDENPNVGGQRHWEYWYDVPVDVSAGSISVVLTTVAGTTGFSWHAWEIVGAASGAPESTQFASNSGPPVTATVTSTAGAALVAVGNINAATQTITVSGDCAERTELDEASYTSASADASNVSAGTRTCTITASTSSGASLRLSSYAAAGASPTPAAVDYYRRHCGLT